MLQQYLPILIFILVAFGIGGAMLTLGTNVSLRKPSPQKDSPYECGFPEFESARLPFDVRFYLVAILFIIFDLETAFFVPWAISLRRLIDIPGSFGFWSMMLFLGILVVGFIYEWKKGALEWE